MKDYKVAYTEKYPFMYIVELKGYSIRTTQEEKHANLLEYLKAYCNNDCYADLPYSKRVQIEMSFDVIKVYNF